MKSAPASANLPCFLRGTRIRTADGDHNVEDLVIGDLLPTAFGRTRPIQWIGRYSYTRSDNSKPWVKDALPVCVTRSALGPNVPHSDLYVTKRHAVFFDNVLAPVGSLINGTTIALYDANGLDELEFFHLKLESHDVIYAEGAPCETLLGVGENPVNFAEYLRTYGTPTGNEAPCVALLNYDGGRSELQVSVFSQQRFSPWIDRRMPIDMIRDDETQIQPRLRCGLHANDARQCRRLKPRTDTFRNASIFGREVT